MHESVRAIFPAFSIQFEGRILHMYLDIKGLVTTGIGNLIDPRDAAMDLPWRWRGKPGAARPGQLATKAEIRAEWDRIKADTSLAARGHRAAEKVAMLDLSAEAIDDLVARKLASNHAELQRHAAFRDLDTWPADAQLALHSMAWAMGPAFGRSWPNFSAIVAARDFVRASNGCKIREEGNPGIVPRNRANRLLFINAAGVEQAGGDPAVLHYRLGDQDVMDTAPATGFGQARVRAMQEALNRDVDFASPGFPSALVADGIWGPRTQAAAEFYRRKHGLPPAEGPTEDLARALGV